jgi:hypothetical protein
MIQLVHGDFEAEKELADTLRQDTRRGHVWQVREKVRACGVLRGVSAHASSRCMGLWSPPRSAKLRKSYTAHGG